MGMTGSVFGWYGVICWLNNKSNSRLQSYHLLPVHEVVAIPSSRPREKGSIVVRKDRKQIIILTQVRPARHKTVSSNSKVQSSKCQDGSHSSSPDLQLRSRFFWLRWAYLETEWGLTHTILSWPMCRLIQEWNSHWLVCRFVTPASILIGKGRGIGSFYNSAVKTMVLE